MFKKVVGDNIDPEKKGWGHVPSVPFANYTNDTTSLDLNKYTQYNHIC